ncbi:MAG: ATP12 family protein [Alphaproteobacteria bacterium]
MKRFYKEVSISENEDGKYTILLDGKTIKTPVGGELLVPTEKLANLIASEWDNIADDEDINPSNMEYMCYTSTATDKIAPNKDAVIEEMCSYAMNDVICYRNQSDGELYDMQFNAWNELYKWATDELNMPLEITYDLMPIEQDKQVYISAKEICQRMDEFELTSFADFVNHFGSFVIAYAVIKGNITVEAGFYKANIDEFFQNQKWGVDEEIEQERNMIKESLQKNLIFYKSVK